MKNQIEIGNYYYLNILFDFIKYYNDKTINYNYKIFLTLNSYEHPKNKLEIMNNNIILFPLVSRYFKAVNDIKVQK